MTAFFFVSTSLRCPFFGTVKVYRFEVFGRVKRLRKSVFWDTLKTSTRPARIWFTDLVLSLSCDLFMYNQSVMYRNCMKAMYC